MVWVFLVFSQNTQKSLDSLLIPKKLVLSNWLNKMCTFIRPGIYKLAVKLAKKSLSTWILHTLKLGGWYDGYTLCSSKDHHLTHSSFFTLPAVAFYVNQARQVIRLGWCVCSTWEDWSPSRILVINMLYWFESVAIYILLIFMKISGESCEKIKEIFLIVNWIPFNSRRCHPLMFPTQRSNQEFVSMLVPLVLPQANYAVSRIITGLVLMISLQNKLLHDFFFSFSGSGLQLRLRFKLCFCVCTGRKGSRS